MSRRRFALLSQDVEQAPSERKILRRGLLASLTGLGAAALIKLTGTEKASALNGDTFIVGNTGSGGAQDATSATRLNTTGANSMVGTKDGGSVPGSTAAIVGSNGSTANSQHGV